MNRALSNNFSDRFHLLCDHAGFIVGRGRQTEVYRFFGVSQVTARNWLIEGFCPRHETLQKIIQFLNQKNRLPENISPQALQLWLEKGDSYIPNPLIVSQGDGETTEHGALNTYKIYRLISGELDRMGIDIDCYPDEVIDTLLAELCNENLVDMSRTRAVKLVHDRFSTLTADSV